MFGKFKYESLELEQIRLDTRNPRIVTQNALKTEPEILKYLFEYADLEFFIKRIANEGKNPGAERPYVVKSGKDYVVVEGNTRIAAYKLLTGLSAVPRGVKFSLPAVSPTQKAAMLKVDCSIAPDRDSLLPIMAQAHFGTGDKTKWGYLGSRKAVFEEYNAGRKIRDIAKAFGKPESDIRELLVEYQLYLEALKLKWTPEEKASLSNPTVEFNPPVRFLQTGGHRDKVGIEYDKINITIGFTSSEAKKKFQHLIRKLVLRQGKGLSAISTYEDVFKDYGTEPNKQAQKTTAKEERRTAKSADQNKDSDDNLVSRKDQVKPSAKSSKSPLFTYEAKKNNALLKQLMTEATTINIVKHPASSTLLLRMIAEITLKEIISEAEANKDKKSIDLEGAINICLGQNVTLGKDDTKILKEFKSQHLDHLNMAAHANVKPNESRLKMARDCIDQFIKRNV